MLSLEKPLATRCWISSGWSYPSQRGEVLDSGKSTPTFWQPCPGLVEVLPPVLPVPAFPQPARTTSRVTAPSRVMNENLGRWNIECIQFPSFNVLRRSVGFSQAPGTLSRRAGRHKSQRCVYAACPLVETCSGRSEE